MIAFVITFFACQSEQADVPSNATRPGLMMQQQILRAPKERQFTEAFVSGKRLASKLPLKQIVARGEGLPPNLLEAYFDGAAHSYRYNVKNIDQILEEILQDVPGEHEFWFYDGSLQRLTVHHNGDPKKVLPVINKYMLVIDDWMPHNGLRIGIQRLKSVAMAGKLKIAATYPEEYRSAIYEELGWRVGNRTPSPDNDVHYFTTIAKTYHCVWVHGYTRGHYQKHLPTTPKAWEQFLKRIDKAIQPCQQAAWVGIGRGSRLVYGIDSPEWHQFVAKIPSSTGQKWIQEIANESRDTNLWDTSFIKPEQP